MTRIKINPKPLDLMDYRLTDEDKERIKLLNEISKNKFKNLSLEQLKRLQELVEKKDYSHQKKANKSKKKLNKKKLLKWIKLFAKGLKDLDESSQEESKIQASKA